jgi:transcriptional regulator
LQSLNALPQAGVGLQILLSGRQAYPHPDLDDRDCVREHLETHLTSSTVLQGHLFHSWLYIGDHAEHTNDRLQGTLDLLVLKTLASRGPMHGYGITVHIEQVSKEILRLEEGSLYPALHRMTQTGRLRSEWGVSENNRRARYYSITAAGSKQLADEEQNWAALTGAVARVLQFT